MAKAGNDTRHFLAFSLRRKARLLILAGTAVILTTLVLGAMSLARFDTVENAWEEHAERAAAIDDCLAELNRAIGYGGFIHNFKNLVLRRDLPRYQEKITQDIAGFRTTLERLDTLLHAPADKAALAQVRATFEEYAAKYGVVPAMVAEGATSEELDAVVKVDDGPALKALAHLNSRVTERVLETKLLAEATHGSAMRFAKTSGALMTGALFAAIILLEMFLRRLITANAEQERSRLALLEAKQQAEEALAMQRKMQAEMVQAEKLAALGGLVAGVAHEINTPVGVTLSAATHLEAETVKSDQAYRAGELSEEGLAEYFATALRAAHMMTINSQRAADLIQSFKQVAVDQTGGEQREFDVAAYVDEILLSLRPLLKKSPIDIRVECPSGLTMNSLPGAFSQVLTNLLTNALIHAFAPDQPGLIVIAIHPGGSHDEQLEITFSDNGRGIPPELHARVFEPFFTTRRAGGGSGLGLHIAHSIVTQSLKGSIAMESAPGQGTTFLLRLPRTLSASHAQESRL